jgi:AcrR family transcriptional regulator
MPKIVDRDQQREDLLVASFDLFADHGYAAITMRQLAQGLGVSTGTLYHYFEGKDDIFEQMVVRVAERDVSAATAEIPGDADRSLRLQLLLLWIRANEDYLRRVLLLILDFQRHRSDEWAARLVRESTKRYREELETQLGGTCGVWPLLLGTLVQGLLEPGTSDLGHLQSVLEGLIRS